MRIIKTAILIFVCSFFLSVSAYADETMPVRITQMGITTEYMTTKRMVADVLYELGISVDEESVIPRMTDVVELNGEIVVAAVAAQKITTQEPVQYKTYEMENPLLSQGVRNVVQEGKPGLCEVEYDVTYRDGVMVSRIQVGRKVLTEAVDEIVECGTGSYFEVGAIPATKNFAYTKMEQFNGSAYDISYESCGKLPGDPYYGITAWGVHARYGVVAVDPTVIPYGTKLYIESADGKYIYGFAVAGDCGGAIKGKSIDLFYDTREECFAFGRRKINVYFIDEPPMSKEEVEQIMP